MTAFASEAQAVTVNAYVPILEATPTAVIDYEAEQLSGLTANGTYTVNGSLTVTADVDGKLALDNSWLGSSLSLVKQGNASTTIDSAAQTVTIPARPAAPAGVASTDETAIHAKDGTLTNVTTAMEYKKVQQAHGQMFQAPPLQALHQAFMMSARRRQQRRSAQLRWK
ncbi:hypothetical protein ACFTAO_02515 [Paenibacillus rhizoplanae]